MTDRERLVVVETKLTAVQDAVGKMDKKLDVFMATFATQTQVSEIKQEFDEKLAALKLEVEGSKRRSALQTWVTGTLSAILGAVLAILIQSYFTK